MNPLRHTIIQRVFAPWLHPDRLWRSLAYVAIGLPVSAFTFVVTMVLLGVGGGVAPTVILAIPAAWLVFVGAHALAAIDRSRAVAILGIEMIDPVPPLESTGWLRRVWERVKTRARWRELAHHLVLFPVALGCFLVLVITWCGSLALAGLPLYVLDLPGRSAKFGLFEVRGGTSAEIAMAALGVVGVVFIAPWATVGLAHAQSRMARWFIGRTSDREMAELVRRAESQREAAVDSAEAERRRIERDLHDGAQQRLVALAANLGAAREKLADDPEEGARMVAAAHEESKAALKEIRDLVRGIHPVILEDRGLNAALSAVVARAPIPVTLDVHVDPRPSAATESAAYFVVNEALTNVARHAQATRASVAIARAGDRLVLEVHDDGVGGADASLGTGLQGLRERVAGLGGTMHVISPEGGPTTISVELPCGS